MRSWSGGSPGSAVTGGLRAVTVSAEEMRALGGSDQENDQGLQDGRVSTAVHMPRADEKPH